MTKVVKGAGRNRHAANRKHQQTDVVVGGKRDDAIKSAARQSGKTSKSREVAKEAGESLGMHKKVSDFQDAAIAAGWSVAYHEDEAGQHLTCTRGKETLTIFWLNGVYQRWAEHTYDGGAPQRVPNAKSGLRVLGASEDAAKAGATKKAAAKRRTAPRSVPGAVDGADLTVDEKISIAMGQRNSLALEVAEMTDHEEIIATVAGKGITWVNSMTGSVASARIPKESKHNKVQEGRTGLYLAFASMEGPFVNVYLTSIITIS